MAMLFASGVLVGVVGSVGVYGACTAILRVLGGRTQDRNVRRLQEYGLDVVPYEPWKAISRGSWEDMKVRALVGLVASKSVLIVDRESGYVLGTMGMTGWGDEVMKHSVDPVGEGQKNVITFPGGDK